MLCIRLSRKPFATFPTRLCAIICGLQSAHSFFLKLLSYLYLLTGTAHCPPPPPCVPQRRVALEWIEGLSERHSRSPGSGPLRSGSVRQGPAALGEDTARELPPWENRVLRSHTHR